MSWDFENKRIFLIGGPGGVGKTTIAAALAIHLSQRGYRTLVLTVDPAKRLAQALGFKDFTNSLQPVSIPGYPNATLMASMLDSEHYFDKVIERFASSPEQKKKIVENTLYRTMVDSLGGSHEYAAMERLLEFSSSTEFDKIVVDTPPTQNALDLLNAPQRLADFMDNSVLRWFQKKGGFHFFQRGSQLAMKALQKVLGSTFLDQLAVFLNDLEGMQSGFKKRHLAVLDLFRNSTTSFVLVTHASEARFLESVEFHKVLQKENIHLDQLILNRMEVEGELSHTEGLSLESLRWLTAVGQYVHELHVVQQKWADAFKVAIPVPTVSIPRKSTSLTDISILMEIGNYFSIS